jgi:hypothetical protein
MLPKNRVQHSADQEYNRRTNIEDWTGLEQRLAQIDSLFIDCLPFIIADR